MTLGNKLKQLRIQRNLTQSDVAEQLEISLSSYQKYERKKNSVMPSIDALLQLADFYGVTTDYLLGRESKPPEPNPFEEMNLSPDAEKKVLETYNAFPAPARAFLLDVIRQLGEVMKEPPPEIQKSHLEYVGTIGEELERREQQARAEAEALRKDTA